MDNVVWSSTSVRASGPFSGCVRPLTTTHRDFWVHIASTIISVNVHEHCTNKMDMEPFLDRGVQTLHLEMLGDHKFLIETF